MKYAVKSETGQWQGVAYHQLTSAIVAHHAQYGEILVPVARLENVGTEDAPIWEAIAPSIEDRRAAMVCSRMQARIALHQAGLLSAVEAAVAQTDLATQIAWQDASEFRRDSPTIAALSAVLDPPLSDEQLDALFEAAAQITA